MGEFEGFFMDNHQNINKLFSDSDTLTRCPFFILKIVMTGSFNYSVLSRYF